MKFIKPKYGDKRVRSAFLLLPRTISNETRWLEFATWEEEYDIWFPSGTNAWAARRWLNDNETNSIDQSVFSVEGSHDDDIG